MNVDGGGARTSVEARRARAPPSPPTQHLAAVAPKKGKQKAT